VRETDLVARLGGDEFALLQLDMIDAASAGTLAEKLLVALAQAVLRRRP
jgi:GGDEF domain-containing protein